MSETSVNTSHEPAIQLSPSALQRLQDLLLDESNKVFRVYITGGGCAGFQYGFRFDATSNPDDLVMMIDSEKGIVVTVAIDPLSMMYLEGAQIDYLVGLQGSYFKINNPHAKTTCGCGSSFSI